MTDIQYIRQEVNGKGLSYAEVARRTCFDPRTVKKYADQEDFNPAQKVRKPHPSPVMDPVKPLIDQWLMEDIKKKKKYRRTAKRIWQLLVDQVDFKGSDRSVRAYVAKRKRELLEASDDAALPLEAKPGKAQVDFGEAPFKRHGEIVDLPYLVLSLPYSNAFYMQVFESENQNCFLEGLKRIFHYMGGVPRTIRFDNLAPAVKKILPHGERELTKGFEQFALHYGFKYEFCNPDSGQEKGHVEAMVVPTSTPCGNEPGLPKWYPLSVDEEVINRFNMLPPSFLKKRSEHLLRRTIVRFFYLWLVSMFVILTTLHHHTLPTILFISVT